MLDNCNIGDHTAADHIHTDIICNSEEPQQVYCLGMVSKRSLGVGVLQNLICIFTIFCIYDLFTEKVESDSFAQTVLLRNCKKKEVGL